MLRALPPMKVSSASTPPPLPPNFIMEPFAMALRMR